MKPNASTTGTVLGPDDTPSVPSTSGSIKVPPLMSSRGNASAGKAGEQVNYADTKIAGEPDNFLQQSMDPIFRKKVGE
jgi:hypothetical protein